MAAPRHSPVLLRNLEAIRKREPKLHERICWPVSGSHVEVDGAGVGRYQLHRTWHPLSPSEEILENSLAKVGENETVFLFGLGMGEQLAALLDRGHKGKIIAWERDPWLLRLILSARDFSKQIATSALRFRLCGDLVEDIGRRHDRRIVWHPFLSEVYRNERALMENGMTDDRAFVCDGTLFVDDLADELRRAGYSVATWDLVRLSEEEQLFLARQFKPKAVFSINVFHSLSDKCATLGTKLVTWEIDPATDRLIPARKHTHQSFIFTYRKANIDALKNAGYTHVEPLPLATNPSLRAPITLTASEAQRYGAPVAFVGASMVANSELQREHLLKQWTGWRGRNDAATVQEAQDLIRDALVHQRSDYSRYLVPEFAQMAHGGFRRFTGQGENRSHPTFSRARGRRKEKFLRRKPWPAWMQSVGRRGMEAN